MPSNTLALGLYELGISKRTFRLTTSFCRFREGERRRLSIGDNFLQQLRKSGVSRVCGEKVAAARTEKLGTHSHTHTHTGRLLYPRYSPAAARVMTTKVLSSRPRINAARPMRGIGKDRVGVANPRGASYGLIWSDLIEDLILFISSNIH